MSEIKAYFMSAGILLALFHTLFSSVALIIESVDSLEASADTVDEVSMNRVVGRGESIVRELRIALYFDEPRIAETCQVAGDERLRQLENLVYVADAEFARGQHVQYSDPRRVGKAFEQLI